MKYEFTRGQMCDPASATVVDGLADQLKVLLPIDYLSFLRLHNGGEGFLGDKYLILWRAEELEAFNREYEVGKYAPGLLIFASNGGGEALGFDVWRSEMPVVSVPFVGMARENALVVASDFSTLFKDFGANLNG